MKDKFAGTSQVFPGYNLIIPNGPIQSMGRNGIDNNAYLIDMHGEVRHKWEVSSGLKYGMLLPNGNLLARTRAPKQLSMGIPLLAGSSASIIEIDWDSNLIWNYEHNSLHHDFSRLKNGNTIVLLWEQIPVHLVSNIKGGVQPDKKSEFMFGDVLREIDSKGEIVWEWRSWEHLDFDNQVICEMEKRDEWTHANSVFVMPDNNILVSLRNTNTIIIIDKVTGDIVWEWGSDVLQHQHDASLLDETKILVLDNATHKNQGARVMIVDILTRKVIWEYSGPKARPFKAPYAGSVERLPNGNWFICQGSEGKIFESDGSGSILWEYTNPYFIPNQSGQLNNGLFRVHRYPVDHPIFRDKNL